jgi:hypothetical protein
VQAALVALPQPRRFGWLDALRSPWWALVPGLSIVVVIGVVALEGESATVLSWLALIAVPLVVALTLGWLIHGARREWAAATVPLFAIAWAGSGSLIGDTAATALTALGCIGLGWLLVSVTPPFWLKLGIYAMAAVDIWFVAANLLQGPNATLTAAVPSGLPRLQVVHFGDALMGFGDLFIAATLGCLLSLPADGLTGPVRLDLSARRQLLGAALVAGLALGFDLLFFAVDTLPATVPVAVALALTELIDRRRGSSDPGDAGDREDQNEARGRQADFSP